MTDLILIGHFSKATNTSKRMLRYYDKMNILRPIHIDADNKYRYYSGEQIALLDTIKVLQSYGFSLKEIKALSNQSISKTTFLDLLKNKEALLRNTIDEQVSQLLRIKKSIDLFDTINLSEYPLQLDTLNLERKLMNTKETATTTALNQMKESLYALPSPALFMEYIEEYLALNNKQIIHYLTFDIDQFAPINDQFGYDIGDHVIYQTYTIISDHFIDLIESGHGIMSRLGGDEIAIFLKDLPKDQVLDAINLTLKSISGFDYAVYGYPKTLTSTCGLYSATSVEHVHELRHMSTKALMDAKRVGGNQCTSL